MKFLFIFILSLYIQYVNSNDKEITETSFPLTSMNSLNDNQIEEEKNKQNYDSNEANSLDSLDDESDDHIRTEQNNCNENTFMKYDHQTQQCHCIEGYSFNQTLNKCIINCDEFGVPNELNTHCLCIDGYTLENEKSNRCVPQCRFDSFLNSEKTNCLCNNGLVYNKETRRCEESFEDRVLYIVGKIALGLGCFGCFILFILIIVLFTIRNRKSNQQIPSQPESYES